MKIFISYLNLLKIYLLDKILPLPLFGIFLVMALLYSPFLILLSLGVCLFLLVRREKKCFLYLFLAIMATFLAVGLKIRFPQKLLYEDLCKLEEGKPLVLRVRLCEDAHFTRKGYCYCQAKIIEATDQEVWVGKHLILLGHYPLALRGEELKISLGKFKLDYCQVCDNKQQALLFIKESYECTLVNTYWLATLRLKIKVMIEKYLSCLSLQVRDFARALLWGDKSYLTLSERELFLGLGLSHLLALSGFHLALWSLGILGVMRVFFSRHFSELLLPFLLFFYVLFTGFYPSLVRAWFFVLVWAVYRSQFWYLEAWSLLSLVLILSLFFDPMLLNSLSFGLSFLAFGAILTQKKKNIFSMSLRIFVATSPLLLFYFPAIPLMGFILTPFVSFFIVLFIAGLVTSYFIYLFVPVLLPFANNSLKQTLCVMEFILKKAYPYSFPLDRSLCIGMLTILFIFLFLKACLRMARDLKKEMSFETH